MLSKLKSLDFRITPQRVALLRILDAGKDRPGAEQVFEHAKTEFPTVSLATIYKTIALLKGLNERGIVLVNERELRLRDKGAR